jgi:hypothetical protein
LRLEEFGPFDGDGDDPRQGIERSGLDRPSGGGDQADRLGADAEWHEPDGSALHRHRSMTGIGAGMRVEFECRLRGREHIRQLATIELDCLPARLMDVPVGAARHRDGDEFEVEPAAHRPRQRR